MSSAGKGNAKKGFISGAVAGGIAGAVDILVTHPTDLIKTRIQLDKNNRKYFGTLDCIKKTIAEHGVIGLYRGMGVIVLGNIPRAASRFGVFEYFNKRWREKDGSFSVSTTFLSGLIAGMTEAVVAVTPMEVIKIKVINDMYKPRPRYRGMFHAARDIIKRNGIRGLYTGLTVTMVKQGTNQAIRFYLMCTQKNLYTGKDETVPVPTTIIGIFGIIAGAASVMTNISLDVIKTRMQAMRWGNKTHIQYIKDTMRDEGPQAFFKGTTTRMVRVCLDVAVTFMVYENVLKYVYDFWG